MYRMSVSKSFRINNNGNARMEHVDIQVNGYRNSEVLDEAMNNYNRGEESPEPPMPRDCFEESWNYLFRNMMRYRPSEFKRKPENKKKKRF